MDRHPPRRGCAAHAPFAVLGRAALLSAAPTFFIARAAPSHKWCPTHAAALQRARGAGTSLVMGGRGLRAHANLEAASGSSQQAPAALPDGPEDWTAAPLLRSLTLVRPRPAVEEAGEDALHTTDDDDGGGQGGASSSEEEEDGEEDDDDEEDDEVVVVEEGRP